MSGSARSVLRNIVKKGVPEQPATLFNFPGTLHESRCVCATNEGLSGSLFTTYVPRSIPGP